MYSCLILLNEINHFLDCRKGEGKEKERGRATCVQDPIKLKKTVHVSLRVKYGLKNQLKMWATRSGMTLSDFITFSLITGSRRQAKRMGVYRVDNDFDYDEISDTENKPVSSNEG